MTSAPSGAPATPEHPDIPDYTLIRVIGSGACGDVWLARTAAGGLRAIKFVHRSRFKDDRPFEREFTGLRHFEEISLKDRDQLALLHLSRDDRRGFFYYVMELADDLHTGVEIVPERYEPATLANVRRLRPYLPSDEVMQIGCELARGLATLHAHGLVHRDVKPANVVLVGGHAKLADIGLVTPMEPDLSFVGTDGYIPPEGPGRPTADVYALGRVLYECATGQSRHDFPRLPPDFEQRPDREAFLELNVVLIRACEIDPAKRYPDAAEMLRDLLRASSMSLRSIQRREVVLRRARRGLLILFLLGAIASLTLWRAHVRDLAQRRRLAATLAANGVRTADAGDWIGALPWFEASARLLPVAPGERNPYIDQIGLTLERCPSPRILWQYQRHINDLHFKPGQPTLAVATESGELDLWDVRSGLPLITSVPWPNGPSDRPTSVQCVRFSPDATLLAIGSDQGEVLLTSAADPRRVLARALVGTNLFSLEFSPDGRRLAAVSSGLLTLLRCSSGQLETELTRQVTDLRTVAFSADGQRLACSCFIRGVEIRSAADQFRQSVELHPNGAVFASVFSPENGHLFTATASTDVLEWDLDRSRIVHTFEHDGAVSAISISSDGKALLTAARDGFLRRWNTDSTPSHPIRLPQLPTALVGAMSSDQRYSAGGGFDGLLSVWDHAMPRLSPPPPPEPIHFAHGVPWSADDLTRATRLLELAPTATHTTGFPTNLVSIDQAQDGAMAACVDGDRGLLAVWKPSGSSTTVVSRLPERAARVYRTEARHGLVTGLTQSNEIFLWSIPRQKLVWTSENPVPQLYAVVLSPDRRHLVWTSEGGALLLDLDDPRAEPWKIPLGGPEISVISFTAAAFSPDSRWLAAGCSTKADQPCPVVIYDLRSGTARRRAAVLTRHRDGIRTLAFSPDNRQLASGGEDGQTFLWRVGDWQSVGDPLVQRGQVQRLAFSDDATILLTGARSRLGPTDTLRLWNTQDGSPASPAFVFQNRNITQVAWDPTLRAWLWAEGYPKWVAELGARVFCPSSPPEARERLLNEAVLLSGRRIGSTQRELTVPVEERLRLHVQLTPAPADPPAPVASSSNLRAPPGTPPGNRDTPFRAETTRRTDSARSASGDRRPADTETPAPAP